MFRPGHITTGVAQPMQNYYRLSYPFLNFMLLFTTLACVLYKKETRVGSIFSSSSILDHKRTRALHHPLPREALGKTISVSELESATRWPQSLSHLFLNSSSSWGCFCQELPMERGLWVPGEEAAGHAQSDWIPSCQQQGQCHHDWPQWRGGALGW